MKQIRNRPVIPSLNFYVTSECANLDRTLHNFQTEFGSRALNYSNCSKISCNKPNDNLAALFSDYHN